MDAQVRNSQQTRPFSLRPREVGQILDAAVVLYRRNFTSYVTIAAVLHIPATVLLAIAGIILLDPELLTSSTGPSPGFGADPEALASYNQAVIGALSQFLSRMLLYMVIALLGAILYSIAGGALAYAIAEGYRGRRVSVREAYSAVRPRIMSLVGLMIVSTLASMLIVVPPLFVWVFIGWLFTTQVIVIERVGMFEALGRSWELVRGSWWRVFGTFVLLMLIGIVVGLVSTVVSLLLQQTGASWVMQNLIVQFIALVVELVYLPVRLASMTLLYFDQRVRREGFDLHLAADRAAGEVGLDPAPMAGGWPYIRRPAPPTAGEATPPGPAGGLVFGGEAGGQ